ncbi:type II secretion system protein GspD [Pontimicrobium sp. IMCC45349]|uniref:type II secretion system protein GspD n=1 Tax=Pontimicrobium sp. IMCC45349 TaxID=3391574 RepID=UPI00399F00DE
MKKLILILLLCLCFFLTNSQNNRIQNIKNQLTVLSVDNVGLTENVKSEINVNNITLGNFLLAISKIHKLNINVSEELQQTTLNNNFPNVAVSDILIFLCQEYNLTIDFIGNILSIKPYVEPIDDSLEPKLSIAYSPKDSTISIDARGDKLYDVFRQIMDETDKNLVFTPGLENKAITIYLQNVPFDLAMQKIAYANDLFFEKTKDNFYAFESSNIVNNSNIATNNRPARVRNSNFFFKILDKETKLIEVNFINAPIANIINDISTELDIDIFTATPLIEAGFSTFKAKQINFDDLLVKLFEPQYINSSSNTSNSTNRQNPSTSNLVNKTIFTFKKEDNIYFFGTENQLSVRKVEIINLKHRSVSLLNDPSGSGYNNTSSMGNFSNNGYNSGYNTNQFDNTSNFNNSNNTNNRNLQNGTNNSRVSLNASNSNIETLEALIPDEVKEDLEIKVDFELNSFYVNGPSAKVERFKNFIEQIDKRVPVVLIEVMIIEVNKSTTLDSGVTWGIGDEPVTTQGSIYPTTDLTISANGVNNLIGSFNAFAGSNLGKVGPNFFATIHAMETNGDLKVNSTPHIATLNGHRAVFSNGLQSYYAVTQRNIYGTDNPQTSEITNYYPIDAQLALSVKPSVSGDGQVQLDIFVLQSSFGARISEDAPPDLSSRSFSSIIRMQDQDVAILGGLEEQMKSNSGSGVPFLARIPVIKWLFSKRVREAKKSKLTILIKPTIIK